MKPIKLDDKDALEQLKKKLNDLLKQHDEMKKANDHWRRCGTMRGYNGLTDEQAVIQDERIKSKEYAWQRQPYPQYLLTNNYGVIKNTRDRIDQISRVQNEDARTYDTAQYGFKVVENKEMMRIQLFFDEKPNVELRGYLKGHGFKWAPSQDAWQRHLNDEGRYAVRRLIQQQEYQKQKKANSEM